MFHFVPAVLFGSVGLIYFVFARRFAEHTATRRMRELSERMSAGRKRYYILSARFGGLFLMILAGGILLHVDWFLARVFMPVVFSTVGGYMLIFARWINEDHDEYQRRYFSWFYRPGNPAITELMFRFSGVFFLVVGLLAMFGVIALGA